MGKTPNKIAYQFSPRRPLDLVFPSSLLDTYIAWADATNAISFALANQKSHYDKKHYSLFIKVGN